MAERKDASVAVGSETSPVTTRRRALQMYVAVAVGCGWAGSRHTAGSNRLAQGERRDGEDALDQALRLLQNHEPESKQGLSTHAPMVAEALCALGRADRAVAWVEGYRAPLIELPRPSARIARDAWRAALGPRAAASTWEAALERWADWRAFFGNELSDARWQDVLDTWVGRLAPGLCAAATHGVIRTAHAARALSRRESPERHGELARGLAYWASAYQELPARARTGERVKAYDRALEQVPLYWVEQGRKPPGNIVNGLRSLDELERFADTRDLVVVPADVSTALSALTATFARVYLRHGTQHDTIAFVHAVTGPCALRRLAPHLRPETAREALPYAWQAAAGIYAAYARSDDAGTLSEPRLTRAELAARAVENGDEHAIKFTEVLLAEHDVNPDPVYLAAAQDAVGRL